MSTWTGILDSITESLLAIESAVQRRPDLKSVVEEQLADAAGRMAVIATCAEALATAGQDK